MLFEWTNRIRLLCMRSELFGFDEKYIAISMVISSKLVMIYRISIYMSIVRIQFNNFYHIRLATIPHQNHKPTVNVLRRMRGGADFIKICTTFPFPFSFSIQNVRYHCCSSSYSKHVRVVIYSFFFLCFYGFCLFVRIISYLD